MAEFQTETLQSAVVRYLQIRRDLGERELILGKETARVLKSIPRQVREERVGSSPSAQPPVAEESRPAVSLGDSRPQGSPRPKPVAAAFAPSAPSAPASTGGDKRADLEALQKEILADPVLPGLFQNAQNMVFGVGDPDAAICFIGEAPGVDEDRMGEPFVGKAGQLLTKMIQTMGLTRDHVYITNLVKYRPDMPAGSSGNRKPTREEMEACRPYAFRQIALVRPQVIVALGATAVEGLLERERVAITRLRGQWQEFEGIPVMPTFHPSYLLRNNSIPDKRHVWEDLLQVMERVNLPISDKQRNFFKKS